MTIYKKCDLCGNEFLTYTCYDKRKRKHRFCSKACEAEFKRYHNTRNRWKGGRTSNSTGYVYIKIDGKEVGEHTLVAEKKIGRRLNPDEVVHHINGNRTDNRPENLQVMTRLEHSILHHPKTKREKPCKCCGKVKMIHGRGLCNNCYHYAQSKGELDKWPLKDIQNTAQ